MSERMCRFDPGSGYHKNLLIKRLVSFIVFMDSKRLVLYYIRIDRVVRFAFYHKFKDQYPSPQRFIILYLEKKKL